MNELSKKMSANESTFNSSEQHFNTPQNAQTIEQRVDELCRQLMEFKLDDGRVFTGYFENNTIVLEKNKVGTNAIFPHIWQEKLFTLIKQNPNEPTIWELVFKKLSTPLITIPLGHGINYTLPTYFWDYHSKGQNKLPAENKDISPENIKKFNECLQRCSSLNILTQENLQVIMQLAKKYSIQWLYNECLHFGLKSKMGDKLGTVSFCAWGDFFKTNKQYNPCHLQFKEFQQFLHSLLQKSPEIIPHLSEVTPLFYFSDIDNKDHTICFGQKEVKLPLYLWKAHSEYYWDKVTSMQDDVSQESLEAFTRCLTHCTSYKILNLKNYKDIRRLADKYQILWLIEDCQEFFRVKSLSKAAESRYIDTLKDEIKILSEKKTLSPNAKETLNKLADEHRLLSLKFILEGYRFKFLPDGSFFIENPAELAHLHDTCPAMKNPMDNPKLEFNWTVSSLDNDLEAISKIIENTKCQTTVRLIYLPPFKDTSKQLSELLNKYPQIKHLKIVLDGDCLQDIIPVLQMIKENTTLESLGLIILNGINTWTNDKRIITRLLEYIEAALKESKKIKKTSLSYSNYALNPEEPNLIKDRIIVRNYKITDQGYELTDS